MLGHHQASEIYIYFLLLRNNFLHGGKNLLISFGVDHMIVGLTAVVCMTFCSGFLCDMLCSVTCNVHTWLIKSECTLKLRLFFYCLYSHSSDTLYEPPAF